MGTTKTPQKLNGNRKSNEEEKQNTKDSEKQEMQRTKKKGSSKKNNVNEKEERNLETEQHKPVNELKSNGTKKQSNGNAKDSGKKRKRKEKDKEEEESKLYAFPMHTVQTIMKSEGSDLNMNQEAYFLINKASEKFMEQFCEDAYDLVPAHDWRGSFKYTHLSSIVNEEKRYDFLTDFVPEKIKFEDALKDFKPTETLRE